MPSPEGSELHIDQALTDVSVAYFTDTTDYIADWMFPGIPSTPRSNVFRKFSKSDFRRSRSQKRAPGTESVGIGWTTDTDRFYCEVYAVHVDLDDQDRANADSDWDLDSTSSRLVTQDLLLGKDILWCSKFFGTGIWGTEYTGVGSSPNPATQFLQWDLAASDPLSNFSAWKAAHRLLTGKKINKMLLGVDVWTALSNHPAILDRIKFTQKGVVTLQLVAEFFEVDQIRVAWASQAEGPEIPDARIQDAAASYDWVANSKGVLFGYAPDRASKMEPSMGYTFNWKGYGAGNRYGLTMSNMRAPLIRSDRIEGEAAYDQKLVSADCGVWLNNVVS